MPGSLFSSYLDSGMRMSAFFPSPFGDREARVSRVRAAVRPLSEEVLSVLRGPEAQLEKLRRGAAAVVTGQQIGLFLGPLYSLYKASTAIVAARVLEEEAGVPCVPLFWLQTEDHDFAEIASCTISPTRVLQLALDDARISVGCRRLGPELSDLVAQLGECLSGQPHAEAVQTLFAHAYREGASLSDAFVEVMARFFPELVFVDPRRLPAASLHAIAIERAAEIERVLVARGTELRQAGFDEQVPIRPGMTLLFHHDGADGPRQRLPQGQTSRWLSTSALLRPILQDFVLPTAAYVGGPGEIAYLAQVTALHPLFELTPPMVVPRARFRLVPPPVKRLLEQLQIAPADAEDPQLLARLAPPAPPGPNLSWLAEVEARLDAYEAPLGPSQRRDTARARRSLRHAMERLERRHRHAALQRESALGDRVRRLQEWLFPGGVPQERVHGVPFYAALAGIEALREAILSQVDVFHPGPKDILL
jgi:uncharacterized protein YllA (UPF0747 family)